MFVLLDLFEFEEIVVVFLVVVDVSVLAGSYDAHYFVKDPAVERVEKPF